MALVCVWSSPAQTAPVQPAPIWITLGTMGGPIASATRSQPANLLLNGSDAYLVDCGDGAAGQLAKAGIALPRVKAVVLSHLHADHTGGLGAIIALRYQTNAPGKLAIYGPPGTAALVAGLTASIEPLATLSRGLGGASPRNAADTVEVFEIADNARFNLGEIRVTARANNHFPPPSDQATAPIFTSLAFRFDAPGRAMVYTGDTGPSAAVEALAQGADLLVSEMIDVEKVMAGIPPSAPGTPGPNPALVEATLRRFHLAPDQVGLLAGRARVKRLVVTHIVAPGASRADERGYLTAIGRGFSGPTRIATDLGRY